MDDNSRKLLRIKKRQNLLRRMLPGLLAEMAKFAPALPHAEAVPMEDMEDLLMRLRGEGSLYQAKVSRMALREAPQPIYRMLHALRTHLDGENYFSISQLHDLWFARVNTGFIPERFEEMLRIDGKRLWVYDTTLRNGLWIDQGEDHFRHSGRTGYEWVYELCVWGDEWPLALLA